MDIWDSLRLTLRHWKFTVPVAVVGLVAVFFVFSSTATGWKVQSTVLLIGPTEVERVVDDEAEVIPQNAFFEAGDAMTLTRVLVLAFTDPTVIRAIADEGLSTDYLMSWENRQPLVTTEVTADTPEQATETAERLIELLAEELRVRQVEVGAPPTEFANLEVLAVSTPKEDFAKPRLYGAMVFVLTVATVVGLALRSSGAAGAARPAPASCCTTTTPMPAPTAWPSTTTKTNTAMPSPRCMRCPRRRLPAPARAGRADIDASRMTMAVPQPSVVVAGAPDDTGNLGVTALNRSIIAAVHAAAPAVPMTVLDYAAGAGEVERRIGDDTVRIRRQGHRNGRRYYRLDNLATMTLARRVGLTVGAARPLAAASAVLDVGGGDSFADLYGVERFRLIADLRQLVLDLGTPLVLLPQTYGPFTAPAVRREAADIVDRSAMAWARDADSFAALEELMGSRFDPARQRLGVDVAFGLPPRRPDESIAAPLDEWRQPGTIGVNISGLVFNDPAARAHYGHRLDYSVAAVDMVRGLRERGAQRIVLVPHVLAPPTEFESDRAACEAVLDQLGRPDDVVIAPDLDADEAKWLISGFDWFCGTRMHATIAALSSGVPCATIAYSLKARGVFATCDMAHTVADARELDEAEALEIVFSSYGRRDADRPVIEAAAARVGAQAADQMVEILGQVGVI